MIFRSRPVTLAEPRPFGGGSVAYRPLFQLGIRVPDAGVRVFDELLVDTGADMTLFSLDTASDLGIDLSAAPMTRQSTANGGRFRVRVAELELTLAASVFHYVRWRAVVGSAAIPRAVLGYRGGLELFTFTSDTTNLRFTLLPNQRMPIGDSRLPSSDQVLFPTL